MSIPPGDPDFIDFSQIEYPPLRDEEWLLAQLHAEANGVGASSERFALEVRTARAIAETPEPDAAAFLVGPLVVRGARTIIVADSGHGKTTLSLQLIAAALDGSELFGFAGGGASCVLVVDLEQGIRSIKRTLTDAGLETREDVLYLASPDGLALDSDQRHRHELERIVGELRPDVVILDPYYKAHRGEANEERGVVDLMRFLDGLRARYGFALLLPAHPRKDQGGRDGARKLKLDDVAGSGAVTRGAEIVLALERLSHGVARLRILKDRDGDLEVGEEWPLLFTRGEGFRLNPKDEETAEELERRVLELGSDGAWRIVKEYATELEIRPTAAKKLLENLAAAGRVEMMLGPPGRRKDAHGYRTVPGAWEPLGTAEPLLPDSTSGSGVPGGYREPPEPEPLSDAARRGPGVGTAPLDRETCRRCGSAFTRGSGNRGDLCAECVRREPLGA